PGLLRYPFRHARRHHRRSHTEIRDDRAERPVPDRGGGSRIPPRQDLAALRRADRHGRGTLARCRAPPDPDAMKPVRLPWLRANLAAKIAATTSLPILAVLLAALLTVNFRVA